MTALVRHIRGGKRRRPTPAGEPACLDEPCLLDSDVDELDQEDVIRLLDVTAHTALREEQL